MTLNVWLLAYLTSDTNHRAVRFATSTVLSRLLFGGMLTLLPLLLTFFYSSTLYFGSCDL